MEIYSSDVLFIGSRLFATAIPHKVRFKSNKQICINAYVFFIQANNVLTNVLMLSSLGSSQKYTYIILNMDDALKSYMYSPLFLG